MTYAYRFHHFLLYPFVCLSLCLALVRADNPSLSCDVPLRNAALVFVKPHANTPAVQDLVRSTLQKHGMIILSENSIDAATIQRKKLIDQHYYAIASKATLVPGSKIPVPVELFQQAFGESWSTVVREKRALNALEACQTLGYTAQQLGQVWQDHAGSTVKLGGGFYCAKIINNNDQLAYYVFNGFFLTMRQQFVEPGASIYCFQVAWDNSQLSWTDFRTKVLGPTDPAVAPRGSLRRQILDQYRQLGLYEPPNKGLNSVHGSASAFEGLVERANWLQKDMASDPDFGQALVQAGLSVKLLKQWALDPRVTLDESGRMGSLFDALEEMDAATCLEELVRLSKLV